MPKKNKSFEDELLEFGLYAMLLQEEEDAECFDYDDDYCDLYFDDDENFIEVE